MDVVGAAVEEVARCHSRHLNRVAYQLTHDADLALDLVQEALLQAYRHWSRQDRVADAPLAYVRRIVVNEYLRRRRLHSSSEVVTALLPDRPVDGFDADVVEADRVWRLLMRLTPRQRAVLVLRFYEQLTEAEIADVVGCRPSTVRSIAARALRELRRPLVTEESRP